ncbi:uncharacterized protein [Palaemon carinicauda]|uniref:uncharacterized protein n=1 Tax=Palaemon carinicauda TaxID=392227 RepID=UPI0035B575EC
MGEDRYHHHYSVIGYLGLVMLFLSLAGPFTCILMIIGLCCDIRFMLLPWLLDAVLVIIFDLIYVAYVFHQEYMNMDSVKALTFTLEFFLLVLNVYTVLCVTSQYQEYVDGRGTASDEGSSRSPPIIHHSRRSTLNSGMDSTRRSVTFLEQGILNNGISPTHNSNVSRAPSIVKKAGLWGDKTIVDSETNSYHFSRPNGTRLSRSAKKHVQFPAETIEETELSEENCDIIVSKVEEKVKHSELNVTTSLIPQDQRENGANSCSSKDQAKSSEVLCLPSSQGNDATLLIKANASGQVTRY